MACEADQREYLYLARPQVHNVDSRQSKNTPSGPSSSTLALEDTEISAAFPTKQSAVDYDEQQFFVMMEALLAPVAKRAGPKAASNTKEESRKAFHFFHNGIHDLESVWWIGLEALLDKRVDKSSLSLEDAAAYDQLIQQMKAASFFYDRYGRAVIMAAATSWSNYVDVLHPAVRDAAEILGELRDELIERYYEVEKDPSSIDKNAGGDLYFSFAKKLRIAAGILASNEVEVSDFSRARVSLLQLGAPCRKATIPKAPTNQPLGNPVANDANLSGSASRGKKRKRVDE